MSSKIAVHSEKYLKVLSRRFIDSKKYKKFSPLRQRNEGSPRLTPNQSNDRNASQTSLKKNRSEYLLNVMRNEVKLPISILKNKNMNQE